MKPRFVRPKSSNYSERTVVPRSASGRALFRARWWLFRLRGSDGLSALASWARVVIPSLGNRWYRCDPTVRWERNSCSPISRLDRPRAASWAICSSCGVSWGPPPRRDPWRGAPAACSSRAAAEPGAVGQSQPGLGQGAAARVGGQRGLEPGQGRLVAGQHGVGVQDRPRVWGGRTGPRPARRSAGHPRRPGRPRPRLRRDRRRATGRGRGRWPARPPGATVTEVPGSHSIYLSQPQAVASLIKQAAG